VRKRELRYSCAAIALACGCLLETSAANAQTAAASSGVEAQQDDGATSLGEVVVTARRREERLQDVPVAVTAIDGAALQSAQIVNAKELTALVPSLNVNSGNAREGNRFTIRGQGVTLGAGEGVVVYLAEAPLPQFGAGGPGLYLDLENLQVLNGPQGTLFGRNTTGGAVLFTPQRPTNENEGWLRVGVGNYENREIAGVANFALAPDVLKIRIAAEHREREGYSYNLFDQRDYDDLFYSSARLGVSFTPTDWFDNYLLVQYAKSQPHGTAAFITMANPNGPVAAFRQPLLNALAAQQARGIRVTNMDSQSYYMTRSLALVNTTVVKLSDKVQVKNIASYFEARVKNGFDTDGSPVPILQYFNEPIGGNTSAGGLANAVYLNEELQFSGDLFDGNLDWVAGGFYQKYEPKDRVTLTYNLFGAPSRQEPSEKGNSKALYAQFNYNMGGLSPALEKINLTAGYRYTWDRKTAINNLYNPVTGACLSLPGRVYPNCTNRYDGDFSAGTYTLGIDYHVTDRTMVYFTQRTGYKSGGFNTNTEPGAAFAAFGPETVLNREMGLKTDFSVGGRPVRLNIAAFNDSYKNIQRNQTVLVPPAPPATTPRSTNLVLNAGAAEIKGVELQGTIQLTDRLQVQANYSFLDAKYTRFVLPGGIDRAGVALPYSPENKYGASIRYDVPVPEEIGEVSVGLSYSYQSHFRAQDPDQPGNIIGDYGLLNFDAEWKNIAGRPVDLEVFVTNVADEQYIQQNLAYYNVFGSVAVLYGEPRMYGARLRYNF
jgi:iron complex outermembrane recepter protein